MEDIFDQPPERLMLLAFYGIIGVMALFSLAVLAKMWGQRMRKGGGIGQGLDLKTLDRQRRTGEISPEEYEAIARRLAEKDKPPAATPTPPITHDAAPDSGPPVEPAGPPDAAADSEGSRTNGQD
jgi:hypothetical protein